jgi:catechol 2,3-dioxygenase-like lactoylglutathione lyase family enzyme
MSQQDLIPALHFHHVHVFSRDCDATVEWWKQALGAEVAFDGVMGGSRNVFMRIGSGRLHIYDQAPKDLAKGAVHHLGIRVSNLVQLHAHLIEMGVTFRSEIREFGSWRYIMCPAPDDILLELFEVDSEDIEPELSAYFSDDSDFSK